jgi:hypothetical protein
MGYQELIDETYRYLYDTAAYYGTGVEYLIGGIVVGVLLVLWVFIRLIRGKRKGEIIVKVMREEPEAAPGMPGGITISPGEVVIKAEGKTTRLPRDKVTVDMQGGKLEIRLLEPIAGIAAAEKPEAREVEAKPEEVIVPEEAVEKPRTLTSAMKDIAKKYSLSSLTLITPEGLLVDSISKTPEEDASLASSLMSKLELGTEASRVEVEDEELRYLFAFPFRDSHAIFIARAKEKLAEEALDSLQEELGKGLELLSG